MMTAWRVLSPTLRRACILIALCLSCSDWAVAAARGGFVDVGTLDAPLRLWVEEDGHGDPILLIHGVGGSTYSWRRIVRALARTHHVISVDLKGFGRSDKPFDRAYGLLDQVRLLKRLINRGGLHDVTLVGHSFGGGVALALTLALNAIEPGAVRQLVLIDSVAYRQAFPLFVQL